MLRWAAAAGAAAVVTLMSGCGGGPAHETAGLSVVAAENFWGSVAAQLGGAKAAVESVLSDPNADPHEYESSTGDARAFADADLVILNGAGYDTWGQKLLDANPAPARRVVVVASVLGKRLGDNPHFWYNPAFIGVVADAITAQYRSLDAGDAAYFDRQRTRFGASLQPMLDEVASLKRTYAGTPVGSTEGIFVYMAGALGLVLLTPPAFMDATSQGNDPPAAAVAVFHDQISSRQIKVLVYNVQTATAVTTGFKDLARAHQIATVGLSETLEPPGATFQDWQLAQLRRLEQALK